ALTDLAELMLEADAPVDAARTYAEAIRLMPPPVSGGGYDRERQTRRAAETGLPKALAALRGAELADSLRELLRPKDGPAAGPALDLGLFAHPRRPDRAAVVSVTAEALRETAGDPAALAEVRRLLEPLRQRAPDDLSVLVAAALADLAAGRDDPAPL